MDLFRGKVTREGKILEASVEPPVELPDEKPNALAVRQRLLYRGFPSTALSVCPFFCCCSHDLMWGGARGDGIMSK